MPYRYRRTAMLPITALLTSLSTLPACPLGCQRQQYFRLSGFFLHAVHKFTNLVRRQIQFLTYSMGITRTRIPAIAQFLVVAEIFDHMDQFHQLLPFFHRTSQWVVIPSQHCSNFHAHILRDLSPSYLKSSVAASCPSDLTLSPLISLHL